MQLLWPLVTTRQAGGYLDLEGGNRRVSGFGRWKQDLHGARVDPRPEEANLLQDLAILVSATSLHLKGTWETQNHQTFCVSLVLVSFTLIYRDACPFLVNTLHDHHI